MKETYSKYGVLKIFLNSLWFGVGLALLVLLVIFFTFEALNFIKPMKMPSTEVYILSVIGGLIGTALILTIRQVKETKELIDNPNRFKRIHEKSYYFEILCADSELKDSLEKNGFSNVDIKNDSSKKVITAYFPSGVYNYPSSAGGYKKYEEKFLNIQISLNNKNLNLKIGPSKWYIPTAFVYSNNYYLKMVERVLDPKLRLRAKD